MTSPSILNEKSAAMDKADRMYRLYPYFIHPQLKALQEVENDAEKELLRRRVAANMGDMVALRGALGLDPEEFASFYPDMRTPDLSTDDAICSFLERFGNGEAGKKVVRESDEGEELPIVPAADYVLQMDIPTHVEDIPLPQEDVTASAIDAFLTAVPPKMPKAQQQNAAPAKSAADTSLTESLARVMVKNHNYRKALEIITQLSLNNPEKSVYFADQIRFLRKLILNESKS